MNATSTKARGNPVDAKALNKLVLLEAELVVQLTHRFATSIASGTA